MPAPTINFNVFLEKEKLKKNGSNFVNWFRNLRIVLNAGDEIRSRQCPLLWTWVLEKMGMLEIAERLIDKQCGTRGLPRFRPPEGKPYSCLSALDYGGTESYRGAQMQSGVRCVCDDGRDPS